MKFVLSFLCLFLVVTNSVLLLFQYDAYSSGLEEEGQVFFYEQEVEMKVKKDKIVIKQHFNDMPKEEVTVSWPIISENRSCELDTSESCNRLTEDMSTFKAGENSKQSISYEIPLEDGLIDGQLIQNFLVKLETGGVSLTSLHITDEMKRGGMWVSGLPVIGKTSLELIDYTLSLGAGDVQELYWQQEVLPIQYEDDYFTIYASNTLPDEITNLLGELDFTNNEHLAVLFEGNRNNIDASRIVFIQNEEIASIQQELIIKNIQAQYDLSQDDQLIAEVLSSFLLKIPVGSAKSIWMYETVNNYLTPEQRVEFQTALLNNNKTTAAKFDEILTDIIDLKTSFFVLNEQAGAENFPLLFEDYRPVYINELHYEEMKVLFKDGKVLYAAEPLLSNIGYTFNDTDKGLYVQNATRAFRFPIQEPFYVLNKKRYDALSEPFEVIGSQLYIEEAWMIRLFLLNIEKQDKRINITQSALF
ncbi:hypothetical protein KD050_17050 [Psychrobacillus sp. INOP01]|uniref:hypothetical protein n=1 Tax=Psychrobacillus sp. INOP01 TaxID=2829187 RepID=UPI001BA90AB5|nr:hypothetical protein [Psychrobacillus sp. INOP01]QUG40979.1 hypothetical protein KD050_17050 [Psychrobacillus sp. INOP01]